MMTSSNLDANRVCRTYRPVILRFLAPRVRPSDLDDVAQEVLLQLACSLARYDPDQATLDFWVHRIAYRVACAYLQQYYNCRRLERPVVASEQMDQLESIDPSPTAEEQLSTIELQQFVTHTLRRLSLKHQQAFELYLQGCSQPEIAASLNLLKSTIQSYLRMCTQELSSAMKRRQSRRPGLSYQDS